jgi:hypothetical protein
MPMPVGMLLMYAMGLAWLSSESAYFRPRLDHNPDGDRAREAFSSESQVPKGAPNESPSHAFNGQQGKYKWRQESSCLAGLVEGTKGLTAVPVCVCTWEGNR